METKSLLFGLIGFFLGGLLVSVAATTFEKPTGEHDTTSMQEMTESLAALEGDAFDKAYMKNMIDHHQSAVDMAKLAAGRAKHEEIKTMSLDVIATQQSEIDKMQSWQRMWYAESTNNAHRGH